MGDKSGTGHVKRSGTAACIILLVLLAAEIIHTVLNDSHASMQHVPPRELRESHGIFYQPQNRDAALSSGQWDDIWKHTRDAGFDRIMVQWTRYGEDDLGGNTGWLAQALTSAEQHGLKLVLGLTQDPEYYATLPDNPRFASYWYQQMSEAIRQQRRLQDEWALHPVGWYLPLELDDWLFRDKSVRHELLEQLASTAEALDGELHLSMFTGGFLSPALYAEWADTLAHNGWHVWWQDGHGTHGLSPQVRDTYEQALTCDIGVIREAFKVVSAEDEDFRAEPATPQTEPDSCHPQAVFSLRYMSWADTLR